MTLLGLSCLVNCITNIAVYFYWQDCFRARF